MHLETHGETCLLQLENNGEMLAVGHALVESGVNNDLQEPYDPDKNGTADLMAMGVYLVQRCRDNKTHATLPIASEAMGEVLEAIHNFGLNTTQEALALADSSMGRKAVCGRIECGETAMAMTAIIRQHLDLLQDANQIQEMNVDDFESALFN